MRYLQNADAEKIAAKLKEQITGVVERARPAAPPGAQTPQPRPRSGTIIWADPPTNALVITATPKVMRNLMSVIDKLDIRRAQVLVEAIIVDVDLSKSASLGRQLGVLRPGQTACRPPPSIRPSTARSSSIIVELVASPTTALASGTSIPTGAIFGVGRVGIERTQLRRDR